MNQHDPRTVDDLFNTALSGGDDESFCDAISALHRRGTREILDRASVLCRSDRPVKRRVAADILAYLGVPERTFPKESASLLLGMLDREKEPRVLQSVIAALYFLRHSRAGVIAASFASDPDPNVRHAVALAINGHSEPAAIALLITTVW